MKARLQHSFDGHRGRDTSIFLHIFSLQHFNFLLFSVPMFPFSYHSFQTDPQAEYSIFLENVENSADLSHGPAKPSPAFADESGIELSMAYEEELIADTDAKDDHRALRARSAECIPVGSKDLVESELISTLAFSPPPK